MEKHLDILIKLLEYYRTNLELTYSVGFYWNIPADRYVLINRYIKLQLI